MHPLITPECYDILQIYTPEIPDFLEPFFESKVIQRLADISQNCGTGYCKLYNYKFNHSRLDHSLGVALIVRNFTKDPKQTLAGFFHDVSHSVFSHVGDFLLGDPENQESSEQHTTKLLAEDEIIMRELEKLGIALDEVDDYTKYSIADNHGPQLSADRLEYTLSTAINLGTKSLEKVTQLYKDLHTTTNEKGGKELGFYTPELAEEFALLSLQNDESCFSSYESTVAQSFLAEILRKMLKKQLVNTMELYTLTESELIQRIHQSNDKELQSMRSFFTQLSQYKIDRYPPQTDQYVVSSKSKRRYIDPLVKTAQAYQRVSEYSQIFVEKRDYHLQRKEERIRLAYTIR